MSVIKTIVIAALALAIGLLIGCSESRTEGCLITHVNGVKLNPVVPFPADPEVVAMTPGYSYQIWCAREIRNFSAGEIISEDQQTLRIASLPANIELEIRPNERDAVYRGRPIPSSANVWRGFKKASASFTPADWRGVAFVVVVLVIAAIVLYVWRRRGQETEVDSVPRF